MSSLEESNFREAYMVFQILVKRTCDSIQMPSGLSVNGQLLYRACVLMVNAMAKADPQGGDALEKAANAILALAVATVNKDKDSVAKSLATIQETIEVYMEQ